MPNHRPAPRITPKVRAAIAILAIEDTTQDEAARRAGIDPSTLSAVLNHGDGRDLLTELQELSDNAIATLRRRAQVAALKAAIDIIENSKADAVRAKMVELFTRQQVAAPTAAPVVHVTQVVDKSGYSYERPIEDAIVIEKASIPENP